MMNTDRFVAVVVKTIDSCVNVAVAVVVADSSSMFMCDFWNIFKSNSYWKDSPASRNINHNQALGQKIPTNWMLSKIKLNLNNEQNTESENLNAHRFECFIVSFFFIPSFFLSFFLKFYSIRMQMYVHLSLNLIKKKKKNYKT